ncbi:outer membrane lipoprotein carrier protein LolA [Anaerophilus nitritogenes]|uniref:outer membrane lipoprotein carrier protein LolA n=1 Tax=Anaerophilus nitritogenes TaxID=2498136 RepID=UPI00101DE957|nr:outer membrane lipoprotein carrier protein LolA [Anaerophilus nitritogenes]
MRIKKIGLWILVIFLLGGCSPKTKEDLLYDVQKKLNQINSYTCKAEIKIHGNKDVQKYIVKQWFQKPNRYKLETIYPKHQKGKVTLFDGKRAWMYHPLIEQTFIMEDFSRSDEQNMFLGYFVKNYLESENVQIDQKTKEHKNYLLITAEIPGNHIYFHKQILWIDIDTKEPFLLEVYDASDHIRMSVKYDEFEYNPIIENDFFNIR